MKRNVIAIAAATGCLMCGAVQAQEPIESNLGATMRFGLQMDTEPGAELSFNDYGSRITWEGLIGAEGGTQGIGYIEFGFDQEGGASTTREAWLGFQGSFGTIKGGKQYSAFYDAVSSAVDIGYTSIDDDPILSQQQANFRFHAGSCNFEVGCVRQASVVKYESPSDRDMQLLASGQFFYDGDDFVNELDFGISTKQGDISLGAGASLLLDTEPSTGFALGLSATVPVGDAAASVTLQYANDDYIGGLDNAFAITGAFSTDSFYGLVTIADAARTPFNIAGGYKMPLIGDQAFIYFEGVLAEPDVQGADLNILGRAVMVFDFDVVRTGT